MRCRTTSLRRDRERLDPAGDVHRVAREPLGLDDHLAHVDADACWNVGEFPLERLNAQAVFLGFVGEQVFLDVPPTNPFHDFVNTVARNGVTAGCGGGDYCPATAVNRAQMAVFLLKGKYGADHVPPAATGTVFTDVPQGSFAADCSHSCGF